MACGAPVLAYLGAAFRPEIRKNTGNRAGSSAIGPCRTGAPAGSVGCIVEPVSAPEGRRHWIALAALIGVFVAVMTWWVSSNAGPATPLATNRTNYDPVAAGEELPSGYRIGFERDQIAPVYDPSFTTADRVDWPADSLVIGVAGDTEAKAYPVTHLNSREMVIDSLEGIPILVTW